MAMKWFGKLAGGVLGALTLGPIGAALGLLLGHQYDEQAAAPPPPSPAELESIGQRFFRATFRIMGYLAKADGRVSEREISAARAVMGELRLNPAQVQEAIACFTVGKQPDFDWQQELSGIAPACETYKDLARVFVEIQVRAALAGNNLEAPVRGIMQQIAATLGISALEMAHVETVLRIQRAHFGAAGERATAVAQRSLEEAYRVLEVSETAGDEEVAKAYRRQLQRHHPDKLKANGLPESMMAHAKQRTQQIIEAWELIRTRRGIR
jgi:DnaJ like chaperone protein